MKRSKELADWAGKASTFAVVQRGLREFAAR
jgi:hypothetical protein